MAFKDARQGKGIFERPFDSVGLVMITILIKSMAILLESDFLLGVLPSLRLSL